jgi:hypothetical protein
VVRGVRLGLAVSDAAVRLLGLRDGVVVWAAESEWDGAVGLERAVTALLIQAPGRKWRRHLVRATIGPSRCQTRLIEGLPTLTDPRVVTALLRENVSRFFLRNGVPLVTSDAVRGAGDTWWGTAFEEPIVDALRRAGAQCRARIEIVVPTIAVIPSLTDATELCWRDGNTTILARVRDGRLLEAHRLAEHLEQPHSLPESIAALAALGTSGVSYLDAFAVAREARSDRWPALVPGRVERDRPLPRWRLLTAAAALGVALLGAALAPGLRARTAAMRAERELARLTPIAGPALNEESELRKFEGAMAEYGRMRRSAERPMTRFLAQLAALLPDSAALIALRTDSAGGQLSLLGPSIAGVMARLERWPLISSPQIVGPITREMVEGRERERATVRFLHR